jgi:hypothetical protein
LRSLPTGQPTQVVLDGSSAGAGAVGLTIKSKNAHVSDHVIINWSDAGISIQAPGAIVRCNYIGTDLSEAAGMGNGTGVRVDAGATGALIGWQRSGNLISGNRGPGVQILGAENAVVSNYIGVRTDGLTALPNNVGVALEVGSRKNEIGLMGGEKRGNVISGNKGYGIQIRGSNANKVVANIIGLDAEGRIAVANGGGGMQVTASKNNIVGDVGKGNTISGNKKVGIRIDTYSTHNEIRSNLIGLNSHNEWTANRGNGIEVTGGSKLNWIGSKPEYENKIAYNEGDGIHISGSSTMDNGVACHNAIHNNKGSGINLSGGAHGKHPLLRIWSIQKYGTSQYYIIGQIDPKYLGWRIDVHSDNGSQGEKCEKTANMITPGKYGWWGVNVWSPKGANFTFTVADKLGHNTSEFLIPGKPAHVGTWDFDMDYWSADIDNGFPLNPHYHNRLNWASKYVIRKNYSKSQDLVNNFAHDVFRTSRAGCAVFKGGFFLNFRKLAMYTGELYWESYMSAGLLAWQDNDNNYGLRTPPITGVHINTQRYFDPKETDSHKRTSDHCPPKGCDANDWGSSESAAFLHIDAHLKGNLGDPNAKRYQPILTLEIDRKETFDKEFWKKHPFWAKYQSLRTSTTPKPGWKLCSMLPLFCETEGQAEKDRFSTPDGKKAIVMGIWTLDCAHRCRSEIHPVLGMAIQEQAPADMKAAGKEVWHFFARRKGGQAVCGRVIGTNKKTWKFRLRGRPRPAKIGTPNGYGAKGSGWSVKRAGNDVLVTVELPDKDDWLVGSVVIDWQ